WHLSLLLTGANKWRRVKGRDKRLDRLDDIKMKIDLGMDDVTFQNRLKETQVLTFPKEWTKWKWELIAELLEGPLNNPQRTPLRLHLRWRWRWRLRLHLRCGRFAYVAS